MNTHPYIKSEFIWTLYFTQHLIKHREDIDPMEAWKLGWDYLEMLPNLLNVSPTWVVDNYLEVE